MGGQASCVCVCACDTCCHVKHVGSNVDVEGLLLLLQQQHTQHVYVLAFVCVCVCVQTQQCAHTHSVSVCLCAGGCASGGPCLFVPQPLKGGGRGTALPLQAGMWQLPDTQCLCNTIADQPCICRGVGFCLLLYILSACVPASSYACGRCWEVPHTRLVVCVWLSRFTGTDACSCV